MATKNTLITIRNRRCELKLTFEFADHIMYNYLHDHERHPLTFLEIQRTAKHAAYYLKQKRTYIGIGHYDGKRFQIVVILEKKEAVLITCYKI